MTSHDRRSEIEAASSELQLFLDLAVRVRKKVTRTSTLATICIHMLLILIRNHGYDFGPCLLFPAFTAGGKQYTLATPIGTPIDQVQFL